MKRKISWGEAMQERNEMLENIIPLIDVDGTLLDFDGPEVIYNDFLIDWLAEQKNTEVVLLTNMNILHLYFLHPSRYDLIEHMRTKGIHVRSVVTPLDVVFKREKIIKKIGDLFSTYFHHIEKSLSDLKKICSEKLFKKFFYIFNYELYQALKTDDSIEFQPIFEDCINKLDKSEINNQQLDALNEMAKEFFIYNVIYSKFNIDPAASSKGEAFLQYVSENASFFKQRPIVFIDDKEKELTNVYDAHKESSIKNLLLVMPQPSNHENNIDKAWEKVHQHTKSKYLSHQRFFNQISRLCETSISDLDLDTKTLKVDF